MEVARKDYYQLQEHLQLDQEPKKQKTKKPKKNYRLEKVMAALGIMMVLALSLPLLLRYATITELKHQVHQLDRQLDQIENQREKLKIEMERVSKSRAIEEAAKERLNMNYPGINDTFYVAVDPTKVSLMNNEINRRVNRSEAVALSSNPNPISKVFLKISNLLNI